MTPDTATRAREIVKAALADATWYAVADKPDWKERIVNLVAPPVAAALAERDESLAEARRALEERPDGLTFRRFRETNVARCTETWHELDVWALSDWATALAGEVGEACNVIKKLRRSVLPGPQHINGDVDTLRADLRDEVADVLSYLDLLAAAAGFTLEDALVKKFNEVSDRVGSPRKLRVALAPQEREGENV